jgi:hypothetical protein|tara:strand:+ start:1083 stop:1409 length:327 start_codon:yes stop_codon:yes gene_type:complete
MIYIQVEHTGKGFVTHADREKFYFKGFPSNVWAVGEEGHLWVSQSVQNDNGRVLSGSEAQRVINEFTLSDTTISEISPIYPTYAAGVTTGSVDLFASVQSGSTGVTIE